MIFKGCVMYTVVFYVVSQRRRVERTFTSYDAAIRFARKLRYSTKCNLIAAPADAL